VLASRPGGNGALHGGCSQKAEGRFEKRGMRAVRGICGRFRFLDRLRLSKQAENP